jgi:plasmid stabilization system protein ParE
MLKLTIRASAWKEIQHHAAYIEEQAGAHVAQNFVSSLMSSADLLLHTPRAGALCGFRSVRARRVRRWQVKSFEDWLIFYVARRSSVEIVHILHAARDIESIFDS